MIRAEKCQDWKLTDVQEGKKHKMKNEKPDYKFIVGMVILVGVMVFVCGFFWTNVSEQAHILREEEARKAQQTINAIYVYADEARQEGVYVNMDAPEEVFAAAVPKEGIYNKNGTLIEGDVPEEGDMFRIYGDRSFTQDVPPVYEKVEKMERTGRSTLEEAEKFREAAKAALNQESGAPD